jgi:hypothetical protein
MINILRKKFFLGYTIGDTTLSITAFSVATLSILTFSITIKNALLSIMTLLIRTFHAYAQY